MAAPVAESKSPSVAWEGLPGLKGPHAWRHAEQGQLCDKNVRRAMLFIPVQVRPTPPRTPPWPRRGYRPRRRLGPDGLAQTQAQAAEGGVDHATPPDHFRTNTSESMWSPGLKETILATAWTAFNQLYFSDLVSKVGAAIK